MKRQPARAALFNGYWLDMRGQRLRRISQAEMRDVWRLWTRHRDIRQGWAKEQRARRAAP